MAAEGLDLTPPVCWYYVYKAPSETIPIFRRLVAICRTG